MPSSGYTLWSVIASEMPTTSKWNLLGANDASMNTGLGFNDGVLIARHFSNGAAGTSAVKPNFFQSTGNTNGTGTRSSSTSSFTVPGTSIIYTTGPSNELLQITGSGLLMASIQGGGMAIQVNATTIGRRTYTDLLNFNTHYPRTLFLAAPNTTYTITLQVLSSGATSICNATTDVAPNFTPVLEMIAWGRT
jgi:hypothetical protein